MNTVKKHFYILLVISSISVETLMLFGILGKTWWILELASHYYIQYSGLLFILTLGLVFLHLRKLAVIPAIGFLITLVVLVPSWIGKPDVPSDAETLRVISYNMQYRNTSYEDIARYMVESKADVIVISELTAESYTILQGMLREAYPFGYHEVGDGAFSIGMFSASTATTVSPIIFADAGIPSLEISTVIGDEELIILGTHPVPPTSAIYAKSRNTQFEQLAVYTSEVDTALMVVGDLNVTPWSPYFSDLLDDGNLQDGRSGFGLQQSWPKQWPALFRIPIDHTLINDHVKIISRETGPFLGSDHRPIVVDVAVQ